MNFMLPGDEEIYDNCTECGAHLWSRQSAISGICPDCGDEEIDAYDSTMDLEDQLGALLHPDDFATEKKP